MIATDTEYSQNEFLKQGYLKDDIENSDTILREKVCQILSEDPDIDDSDIKVVVNKGTVLLSGTVLTRDERFRAEMAIENINGIEEIQNNIKLRKMGYRH